MGRRVIFVPLAKRMLWKRLRCGSSWRVEGDKCICLLLKNLLAFQAAVGNAIHNYHTLVDRRVCALLFH